MSNTALTRQEIYDRLNEVVQRGGNLTILFTNALTTRLGLSAVEFECLSLLRDGPLPAGRLAELCGLSTGAVTGLVDRLERAGYARRSADPTDRRRVIVSITRNPELEAKATELYGPLAEAFVALADTYSVEDLQVVLGYMQASNEILERLTAGFHSQDR